MDEIMTVEDVAEVLKVTDTTIRKAITDGKLKAFKQLGRWYVFASDLRDFIKSGQASR